MIFGKSKKNLKNDKSTTRPLETAAINRWRSVDKEKHNNSDEFDGDEYVEDEINEHENSQAYFLSDEIEEENFEDNSPNMDKFKFSHDFTEEESGANIREYSDIGVSFNDSSNLITEKYNSTPEHDIEEFSEEVSSEAYSEEYDDETVDSQEQETFQEEKLIPPREITPAADFSLDYEEDIKQRFGENLKSALGSGTMIEGMFSFDSPVKIDGVLKGEIKSNSALIVGPAAKVSAKIQVGSLIVLGKVEGEVEAEDLIEIRSTGALEGDVITRRIALEEGGMFNGACTMLD